jgi:hypothetical protein
MKRIISAILISAALAFGFASCDDGAAGGASWNPVGTWKCVSSNYGDGSVPFDERYEFKSNGTYEYKFNGELQWSGTYEYDDNRIYLTNFGTGHVTTSFEYDSATKKLVFRMTNDIRRYVKQ